MKKKELVCSWEDIKNILASSSSAYIKLKKISLLTPTTSSTRYFVVWYKIKGSEYKHMVTCSCRGGLNENAFKNCIAINNNIEQSKIFITNWKELSESDYNDWRK